MTEISTKKPLADVVRELLKDLLKIIKIVSMYPENNPLPQSMKRNFAERLEQTLHETGDIQLVVERDRLLLDDETVFVDRSREESLAGLLFDVGVASIVFRSGLDINQIYKLLDVIKNYVNAPRNTYDLVNAVWEAGFTHFGVTTIEDIVLADYDSGFNVQEIHDEDSGKIPQKYSGEDFQKGYKSIFGLEELAEEHERMNASTQIRSVSLDTDPPSGENLVYSELADSKPVSIFSDDDRLDEPSLNIGEAVSAMGFEDIEPSDEPSGGRMTDTTIILNDEFKLSEEEEIQIRELLNEDAQFDMFESTAELVKEMLHQETTLSGFNETAGIVEKVLSEFVLRCKLVEAGLLLDYTVTLADQIEREKPMWAQRLRDIRTGAGSRDQLKTLIATLNENEELGADELRRYLNNFGWEALGGITDMLGDLEHQQHREAVCGYLSVHGRKNIHVVAKGMDDKRWYVVRNSVLILAHIGDDEAIQHLNKAVHHEEKRVRMELVTVLKDMQSDGALDILKTTAKDPDYEIRRASIRSIVARRGQPAFDAITDLINDPEFGSLDQEEQQMLLNAYSVLGGEYALEFLSKLIKQPNLLRDHSVSFLREAAFAALAHNRSEKAEKFLVSLSNGWRPNLKQMASDTLRKRREILYGGGDGLAG